MNKTALIVISVIIALLALFGIIYFGSARRQPSPPPVGEEAVVKDKANKELAETAEATRSVKGLAENSRADKVRNILSKDDQKKRLQGMEYQFDMKSEDKMDFLEELLDNEDPRIAEKLLVALEDPDPEVRLLAAEMIEDLTFEGVSPDQKILAVEKALDDQNEEVREAALNGLREVESIRVCDLMQRAMNDPSELVRETVFDVVEDRTLGERDIIFSDAMKSNFKDIKVNVIDNISFEPTHPSMDILIEGMNDKDPEVREEAKDNLDLIVDKEFESYDAAKNWWSKNKHRFDEEVFEIEDN